MRLENCIGNSKGAESRAVGTVPSVKESGLSLGSLSRRPRLLNHIYLRMAGDLTKPESVTPQRTEGLPKRFKEGLAALTKIRKPHTRIPMPPQTLTTTERRIGEVRESLECLAPLPDLRVQNLDVLHGAGEIGESLLPYYDYALRIASELATVRIFRKDDVLPYASPGFSDGRHSVVIPLEANTPNVLRDKISSGGLSHIAESFGMHPEELAQRPDLLLIHAAIHELGHTDQYRQYESDPEAFGERRQQEIDELPVPGENRIDVLRAALNDESSSQSTWVRSHWEALQKQYGVQSARDLIDVQSKAKRNMFHERYADAFAVRVIKGVEQEKNATTS